MLQKIPFCGRENSLVGSLSYRSNYDSDTEFLGMLSIRFLLYHSLMVVVSCASPKFKLKLLVMIEIILQLKKIRLTDGKTTDTSSDYELDSNLAFAVSIS